MQVNPFTLAFAVVVSFTLPSRIAGPDQCSEQGSNMYDLDSLLVQYREQNGPEDKTAFYGAVWGREGTQMDVDVPTSLVATVWARTKRPLSPWSCPSNLFTVNGTLSVPPTRQLPPPKYFDIAGREVALPTSPGIYLLRTPGQPTVKIVRIR